MKFTTADIARYAIVIALYVVFTVLNPFSYSGIQFRVSEVLVLLCFYNKKYCFPLIIACFISNLFSPFLLLDVPLGTLATAIAVYCIHRCKNLYLASIFPVITNGIIVAIIIMIADKIPFTWGTYFALAGSVALGEFVVVCILGCILFKFIERNKELVKLLDMDLSKTKKLEESSSNSDTI